MEEAQRKKRKVVDDDIFLEALPSAKMYEKSFMHREQISHVFASNLDGIVKFWKRLDDGQLEFAKAFRAHAKPIVSAVLSPDGAYLATACADEPNIKLFDIASFDMMAMLKVPEGYVPGLLCWSKGGSLLLSSADRSSKKILRWEAIDKPSYKKLELNVAPSAWIYSSVDDCLIVADADGTISYYDAQTLEKKEFEGETHLEDAKGNRITAFRLSDDCRFFVVMASDRAVRVFRTATGRLYRKYDESLAVYDKLKEAGKLAVKLEDKAYSEKISVEQDIDDGDAEPFDALFDESGSFLLYSSLLGIKVLSLATNRVTRYVGPEESVRFTRLALLQHESTSISAPAESLALAASENARAQSRLNPILVGAGWKQSRFYVFSQQEPSGAKLTDRDILNEKPTKLEARQVTKTLPTQAIIRTTLGDIVVKLLPEVAPLAVENFTTHSRNGYYDALLFHRVIRGFMVQTGDPLGDGTGGESIWGHDFRDEIQPEVTHDQPFTVSMANAGPGTNGSQFFITTVKCPWLDGKHTIFGRVIRGSDVVSKIESVETDDLDKPKNDIKILQIDIMT